MIRSERCGGMSWIAGPGTETDHCWSARATPAGLRLQDWAGLETAVSGASLASTTSEQPDW